MGFMLFILVVLELLFWSNFVVYRTELKASILAQKTVKKTKLLRDACTLAWGALPPVVFYYYRPGITWMVALTISVLVWVFSISAFFPVDRSD